MSVYDEVTALRAENARLIAQLMASRSEVTACKSKLVASKDEAIACKNALSASTKELQQYKDSVTNTSNTAANSCPTCRSNVEVESPLDKDEMLDHVFGFVGGGDHAYTAGVSRRWQTLAGQLLAVLRTQQHIIFRQEVCDQTPQCPDRRLQPAKCSLHRHSLPALVAAEASDQSAAAAQRAVGQRAVQQRSVLQQAQLAAVAAQELALLGRSWCACECMQNQQCSHA
jgi:hypothetical protein